MASVTIYADVLSYGLAATPITTRSGLTVNTLPGSTNERFGASTTDTTYNTDIPNSDFANRLYTYISNQKAASDQVEVHYYIEVGADGQDSSAPKTGFQASQNAREINQVSDISNALTSVIKEAVTFNQGVNSGNF